MRNRRKGLPAACVAVLAVAPLHAHAVRVDYAVDAGVERNDNVLMSSTDPTESSALRAGVGFVVAEETSTVQANIGGRFDYWNYVDGPQSNAFETRPVRRPRARNESSSACVCAPSCRAGSHAACSAARKRRRSG